MPQSDPQHGRTRNAEGARQAILLAAQKVFAEHGFDGARVDDIAAASGYNKSLIFQYYGDKLNLYLEVIRRADAQTRDMQTQAISWLEEGDVVLEPEKFVPLLKRFLGEVFDFYGENPEMARTFLWEMAEGWQTYAKIGSQIDTSEIEMLAPLLARVRNAGLLHSDFDPAIQVVTAELIVMLFLGSSPLFQLFFPAEGLPAPEAMARARTFIIDFITRGLMAETPEPKN